MERHKKNFKWNGFATCVLLVLWTGCSEQPKAPPWNPVPAFDANRAFAELEKQVAFGPRNPGSAGHRECRDYLKATLDTLAESVNLQTFSYNIPKTGEQVELSNVIASFGLQKGQRLLLAAHWDTRPWADNDPDSANHQKPVMGANDAASGVAVLLEVARVLKSNPPPVGVDIVLFDGEDFGSHGQDQTWAIGSQHFANKKDARFNPYMGILLDMIGDRNLTIRKEGYSMQYAPNIVNYVWNLAARVGAEQFLDESASPIMDDHVPLLKAGIPCIDLIDFDYKYWHTVEDTPDKCSPASLEAVGKVVLAAVYNPPALRFWSIMQTENAKSWVLVTLFCGEDHKELLSAALFEQGARGLEEREGMLMAYYSAQPIMKLQARLEAAITAFCRSADLPFSRLRFAYDEIPIEDWHKGWQKYFKPVYIDKQFCVRPPWETCGEAVAHEIILEPKQAFGTGNHATTRLMLEAIAQRASRLPMRALDAGTGSGILAIAHALCQPRSRIFAFDIDPASIINAQETASHNNVLDQIQFYAGGFDCAPDEKFSLIYANLQRHIITPHLNFFLNRIANSGEILFSGILASEQDLFTHDLTEFGFQVQEVSVLDEWIAVSAAIS